ncbi:MAG: alpha/beta hydrolase [Bacteroidota bacterium]
MPKQLLLLFVLTLSVFSCSKEDTPDLPGEIAVPTVQQDETYTVNVITDIIYGEGLSHTTLNGPDFTSNSLLLDAYVPDNNLTNRPAVLLIHGGGFINGSRKDGNIVRFAEYFASRGFVAFSISYRLSGNLGTVPQAWVDYGLANVPVDSRAQFNAIYPANRDAKAALRWLHANVDTYRINPDYITVGGGSAGANTSINLGVTDPTDYTNELTLQQDPTLISTNLEQPIAVHTILDLWGSGSSVVAIDEVFGFNRFDATDAPVIIIHGTNDFTVDFSLAEELRDTYISNGVPYEFYPLQGAGHSAWSSTINGESLESVCFDFVVDQQKLTVE